MQQNKGKEYHEVKLKICDYLQYDKYKQKHKNGQNSSAGQGS